MRIDYTTFRQPASSIWRAAFVAVLTGIVSACEFSYGFGRSAVLAAIPDYSCVGRALATVPDSTTEPERVSQFNGIALNGPTPTYERGFLVSGEKTYLYGGSYAPAFVDVAFEDYRNGRSSLRLLSIYEYSEPTTPLGGADRDLMDAINKQLTAMCGIPQLPPSRKEEAFVR